MRAKCNHTHGITNVWRENAVRGTERLKQGRFRALPGYFNFDNPVAGINATDLLNLNALLGAGDNVDSNLTLTKLERNLKPLLAKQTDAAAEKVVQLLREMAELLD